MRGDDFLAVLVNGVECATVNAFDRGLAYGDGVFRTLRIASGDALHWPHHYRKLSGDCAALGISCPEQILLSAELALLAARHPDCVARIIITRGTGRRGYAATPGASPTRILSASPFPQYPAAYRESGVAVRVCDLRLGCQPRLAGIKHLNRLENVLARREWDDADIAEGLLCDAENNVIGGVMSNVFIAEDGALVTPDLSRCGVAGVQRERLLEAAQAAGVPCRVESVALERLLDAQEVLLTNSVIGAWRVRRLGGKTWDGGEFAARARRWLA